MIYSAQKRLIHLSLVLAYCLSFGCDDNKAPPSFRAVTSIDMDIPLAGQQTVAGETVEAVAGEVTGETAGDIAGETAGDITGEAAGDIAGETAGETAGEMSNSRWGLKRRCQLTLNYASDTAGRVQVAGTFTDWSTSPLEMTLLNDVFSIDLSTRTDVELIAGERYSYKFIIDGEWILDPKNTQQQFDGECVNSAFTMPICDRPQVTLKQFDSTWEEASRLGGITGELEVAISPQANDVTDLMLMMDGELISYRVDASLGRVYFSLENVEKGKHLLSVRVTDDSGETSVMKHASIWVESTPFDWRDTSMYMLLVDRFANGDQTNDAPIGDPVQYSADWHGGDLQGALRALEDGYFDRLGVKAIWLSPINLQVDGHFPDRIGAGRRFSAYHGYWPISGQQVDARYGGDEGLEAFVQAAHARGIRVLLDLINNQVHEQHIYYQQHPEWFRTGCVCGQDPGCGWSERPLDCLFAPYLPDINWKVFGAEQQFIEDALFWVERFDIDGFRVDAVKHVETTSIYNLRASLADRFGGDGLGERVWMFGETAVGEGDAFNDGCGVQYADGYEWIDAYTGKEALDGQFDFPTHHRLRWPLISGSGSYWEIDRAINDALSRYHPNALHVRFLGSHDSTRIASEAALDPQLRCRYTDEPGCEQLSMTSTDPAVFMTLKRAWLLLWTMPGIPLLYYGDEIALAGGNDPDSRRDMPWEGTLANLAMSAPNIVPDNLSFAQIELRNWLSELSSLRTQFASLSRGEWQTIWVGDDVYVYARFGTSYLDTAELSVIAMTQSALEQIIDIPIPERLRAALTSNRSLGSAPNMGQGILTVNDGNDLFTLTLPAGEATVWVWSGESGE